MKTNSRATTPQLSNTGGPPSAESTCRADATDAPLSVVVTSRNDNHGGTLLRRMQAFLNGFIGHCKRHNFAAELIIVEWNPPADKPPLVEALKWPDDLGPCTVRIIQVPSEIHARLRNSSALPLFQMIAKNVGIRRARGKFVLATNIDILFSDELMRFLAAGRLEEGRMYRIDRHDVATDAPVDGSVEEQLAFCRNNQLRLNARAGTFRLTPDGRMCPEQQDVFDAGEFILDPGWNPVNPRWNPDGKPSRWLGKESALTLRAPEGPPRPLRMAVVSGPSVGFASIDLEVRDDDNNLVARGRVYPHLHRIDVNLPLRPGEIGRFRFCVPVPVVPDPDGWERAVHLKYCGWAPPTEPVGALPQAQGLNVADVPESPDPGVAPDDSIRLGLGWIPLHYYDDQPLHLATRESTIFLVPRCGPPQPLRLVLESGSGVGFGAFDLEVRDENDEIVVSGRVESGKPVLLDLPDSADRSVAYRLRVLGGVGPDPDGWERCFRLRSVTRGGSDECTVKRPEWVRFAVATDPPVAGPPVWYRAARRVVRLGRTGFGRLRGHTAPVRVAEHPSSKPGRGPGSAPVGDSAHRAESRPGSSSAEHAAPTPAQPAERTSRPADLHTTACGDFTLMSRGDWFDLRANPELEIFSMHIDSIMCHIAHHAGVRETVLTDPMRIYHIEHGAGSGWTPEGETLLADRMTQLGIQVLSWQQLYRWTADMQEYKAPMIFNGPDWGLAREALPETVLSGAVRAAAA